MSFTNFDGSVHIEGKITASTNVPSDDAVGNAQVGSSTPIDAEKVEYQYCKNISQAEGSAIIDANTPVHICRSVGEIVAVEAIITGALPIGTGDIVSIDVKKYNDGAATAGVSVMTGAISMGTGDTLFLPSDGTLDGTNKVLASEDVLVVEVNQTTTGTQGQGLAVCITLRETPPGT